MIKLININKSFKDKKVLIDINYHFKNKGIYLIKGESGIGKTTLLKIIAGRIKPDSGKLIVKEEVFFLSYNDYLVDELKVREIINLHKEIYKDFKELDDTLEIEELKNKKIKSLSLGEKQRLGIYLAFSCNTKIVILDELLSGIDIKRQREVIKLLKKESRKKLIILVSHQNIEMKHETITLNNMKNEVNGNSSYVNKVKNINYKWGYILHFKQFIPTVLFLISLFSIYALKNNIVSKISMIENEFTSLYSNDIIHYKNSSLKLDETNFYNLVVKGLNREVKEYYYNVYSKEMYSSVVTSNNKYIANGFSFAYARNIEYLNEDEVILEINKSEFCNINKVEFCNEREIKESLMGDKLTFEYQNNKIEFKIRDIIFSNKSIVNGANLEILNSKLINLYKNSKIYKNYIIAIDIEKENQFYHNVNQAHGLSFFDYIYIDKDEKYIYFQVKERNHAYFTEEEIKDKNLMVCLEIGFSCNAFEFTKFKSLHYINQYYLKDKISLNKSEKELGYNEIIISRGLKDYLGIDKGENINLKFYIENTYYNLENVKVIDIKEDNKLTIYHDKYDFELFNHVFNYFSRIEYVYGEVENYPSINLLYYDLVENLKIYVDGLVNFLKKGIYLFFLFIFIILFIIERYRHKKHYQFYSLLYFNKVDYIKIFNCYHFLYLLAGIIVSFDYRLMIMYYLVCFIFYITEKNKIKSRFPWM